MRTKLIGCAVFLILALGSQGMLPGQAVTGTLLGTVLDPTGAVVPNANVTLTNEGTGVTNHMPTSAQGFYTFPTLEPGRYSVSVSASGFRTTVAKGNLVQVEQSTRVDVTLSPGAVDQQVTVTGQNPLVETTTSDLGTVIDAQQINNLPVNGRLFQTLMFLAPGTTPAAWGDQIENPAAAGSTAPGGGGGGTYSSVNGFPFQGNLYLVDGVLNVEPQNAYITIAIPFADIAEMKMETNNPTAEYGTFGGAVVNLTTKTGTNQFHGQLFEYVRNTDFNAKDAFSHLNPPYHANQFGGEIAGPIFRDKLFFSGDFQELLQHAGASGLLSVPTAAMRTGDLSAFGSPITNTAACQIIATAERIAGRGAVHCEFGAYGGYFPDRGRAPEPFGDPSAQPSRNRQQFFLCGRGNGNYAAVRRAGRLCIFRQGPLFCAQFVCPQEIHRTLAGHCIHEWRQCLRKQFKLQRCRWLEPLLQQQHDQRGPCRV